MEKQYEINQYVVRKFCKLNKKLRKDIYLTLKENRLIMN